MIIFYYHIATDMLLLTEKLKLNSYVLEATKELLTIIEMYIILILIILFIISITIIIFVNTMLLILILSLSLLS